MRPEPEPKKTEGKIFGSREEVEKLTLFDLGKDVTLTVTFRGSRTIKVPRWNVIQSHECSSALAEIIAALYPHDLLFLYQLDYSKRADAASKIHKILMYDIYDPAMQIICKTLNIVVKEEVEEFLTTISTEDVMELFCTIVEQEINSERIEAIIKKFQRLVTTKFPLQNVQLGLQDIVTALQSQSSTPLQ